MDTVLGMTDLQIRFFTAIGQIAVAGIVGYIAWEQWRTARKKLKADLFDRRFSTYRDLVKHVHHLTDVELTDLDAVAEYGLTDYLEIDRIGGEIAWIFGAPIAEQVQRELAPHARSICSQLLDLTEAENPSERMHLRRQIMVKQELLLQELRRVTKAISPDLEIRH